MTFSNTALEYSTTDAERVGSPNVATLKPNTDDMRAQLNFMFGGEGAVNGLIEIAWTVILPDGTHKLSQAELFSTDKIETAVAKAAQMNAGGRNVYVGAALRKPETAPFGRSKDGDVLCATCVWVDCDDPGAAQRAKLKWGRLAPRLFVLTGNLPHSRAHMWWKLNSPLDDHERIKSLEKQLAEHFGGDPLVFNPGRVMRLAGSIAHVAKPGRVAEMTCIWPLKKPGPDTCTVEQLVGAFPANAVEVSLLSAESAVPLLAVGQSVTPACFDIGPRDDGREMYMRDTILAGLKQYIGENGCEPTATELFDLVWPQYERNVDLTKPGRGVSEFLEKCTYTIARFQRGDIVSMPTLESAVASYQSKQVAGLTASGSQINSLARIDAFSFHQLMTEEVEEVPDYIEPAFAGPGGFVLIAGPPKAQKSFLLQEILVACATGSGFLMNAFLVPKSLKVFYLQAEMNAKMLRKRARVFPTFTPEQTEQLKTNLIVSNRFHMILNDDGVANAVATIRREYPGAPPDVIAMDPMQNLLDVENENDNAQMMRFITQRLENVRQQVNPDAVLMVAHHTRKMTAEEMGKDPFISLRGASALRGYYDSCVVIYRTSDEGAARKIHFEMRSGEAPPPMVVEMRDGRFIKCSATQDITKDIARKMLSDVRTAFDAKLPLSPFPAANPVGRQFQPVLAKKYSVNKKQVDALMHDWIANKVITFRPLLSRVRPAGFEVTGGID